MDEMKEGLEVNRRALSAGPKSLRVDLALEG